MGLENHLNYIHRPGGQLSDDETLGLAALYNSHLLDTYFRTINGNTQVSATELRSIPLPAHEIIVALGQRVKNLDDPMQHLELHVRDSFDRCKRLSLLRNSKGRKIFPPKNQPEKPKYLDIHANS